MLHVKFNEPIIENVYSMFYWKILETQLGETLFKNRNCLFGLLHFSLSISVINLIMRIKTDVLKLYRTLK